MKKRCVVVLISAVLMCAGLAWAAEEAEPAPDAVAAPEVAIEQPPEQSPMPVYGMQAWIDEESGVLRAPTRQEALRFSKALQQMFRAGKTPAKVVTDKSGMMTAELNESMMEFSVVRVDADGTLTRGCVDDAAQALEFIAETPKSSGPEEE